MLGYYIYGMFNNNTEEVTIEMRNATPKKEFIETCTRKDIN